MILPSLDVGAMNLTDRPGADGLASSAALAPGMADATSGTSARAGGGGQRANERRRAICGVVHIVDGHPGTREAAVALLRDAGIEAVGHSDGSMLIDAAHGRRACILLDLGPSVEDGLALLTRLRAQHDHVPVIAMAAHADVRTAVAAMKRGACDFVERPLARHKLLPAIGRALERRRSASGVASKRQAAARLRLARLSRREREVLERLVGGATNRLIADAMGLSARTVEMYRANMMTKLEAIRLADALRIAYDAGLAPDRRQD